MLFKLYHMELPTGSTDTNVACFALMGFKPLIAYNKLGSP